MKYIWTCWVNDDRKQHKMKSIQLFEHSKKLPKRNKTLHTKHCQSIHAGAWWAAASSVMCRRVTWCCCDSYQLIYTLLFQLVGDLLDEKLDPVSVQLNTKQSKEKKKISLQPPRTTRTTSWKVHYGNISCCPWIREEVKVETRYMMTRALCCDTSGTQSSIKPSANRGRHPACPILTYM